MVLNTFFYDYSLGILQGLAITKLVTKLKETLCMISGYHKTEFLKVGDALPGKIFISLQTTCVSESKT